MTDFLSLSGAGTTETVRALRAVTERTQNVGLTLTEGEMALLAAARQEALARTGRVEFGAGVLPDLAFAFCDSPCIERGQFAQTLMELQELFYYFKNESEDTISDDELIEYMKKAFDGPAQGSLEYLSGTSLEQLGRIARGGEAWWTE